MNDKITLFTGYIPAAIASIQPSCILNISSASGTGCHLMSNILFRDYPEYNQMLDHLRYQGVKTTERGGRYQHAKHDLTGMVLLLGFLDYNAADQVMCGYANPQLVNILTNIKNSMMADGLKSIILPYLGRNWTGYGFPEYVDLVDQIFDHPDFRIYISVSDAFLNTIPNTKSLVFNQTVPYSDRRVIYAGKHQQPIRYPQGGNWVNGWVTSASA